ncbi:MAG: hypothetical protein E3J83_03530 [Candidatus Atribacteria bacterium]|nr:MAG: hypothetical protein E3J83_03530 [Candidatus Atribacteria bacterium]
MKLTEDIHELLDICDTIKFMKNCKVEPERFLIYMKQGISAKTLFPYVEYRDGVLKGCVILQLTRDLNPGLTLTGVWCWIDKHSPKLFVKIIKLVNKLAIDLGVNRITICTQRNADAVLRKLDRYGYEARYTIFEKEIK